MRVRVRAAFAMLAAMASAACRTTTVVPAIKCTDPCCGGHVNIDCAETPNVSCIEDADPCSARSYGCVDGSYYLGYPELAPSTCDDGGADVGVFVLGDGPPPDAPDADRTASD